jgi:hypothetical protein
VCLYDRNGGVDASSVLTPMHPLVVLVLHQGPSHSVLSTPLSTPCSPPLSISTAPTRPCGCSPRPLQPSGYRGDSVRDSLLQRLEDLFLPLSVCVQTCGGCV